MIGVGEALARLRPDLLVVLGDRYELLAIRSAATMLNDAHRPRLGRRSHARRRRQPDSACRDQARPPPLSWDGGAPRPRIVRMGEEPSRVFAVGEPGLDNFLRTLDRAARSSQPRSGSSFATRWVMFTSTPETLGAGAHALCCAR